MTLSDVLADGVAPIGGGIVVGHWLAVVVGLWQESGATAPVVDHDYYARLGEFAGGAFGVSAVLIDVLQGLW